MLTLWNIGLFAANVTLPLRVSLGLQRGGLKWTRLRLRWLVSARFLRGDNGIAE